jgi:hypothetical protein
MTPTYLIFKTCNALQQSETYCILHLQQILWRICVKSCMWSYVLVDFFDFDILDMMIETLLAYMEFSIGADCIKRIPCDMKATLEIRDDLW